MSFDEFKGSGHVAPRDLPWESSTQAVMKALTDPHGYIASDALRSAVNVSLALGMPLLLTGEPGTGKTQLAFRVALELGLGEPLRFDTKSSSVASELFYQFDNVAHYASSQLAALRHEEPPPAREFVRYRALGAAILRSRPWDEVRELVAAAQVEELQPCAERASVVLIDEIDKAPRDFPNDLLSQIDGATLSFEVPELGRSKPMVAAPGKRPVVIITSNSEKQLPEAFLRRCVYHHIAFPKDEQAYVRDILAARIQNFAVCNGPGFDQAVKAYFDLRATPGIEKKPSTSELLDWIRALGAAGVDWRVDLAAQAVPVGNCIGTLAKSAADHGSLRQVLKLAGAGADR
jgi:MoxR-like ATPase